MKIEVYATEELGISPSASVYLIMVINGVGIFVRAPCGYVADRYLGPLNCLIIWVALCAILVYCWIAVHNIAGLYVFAVFYGLASSAAMGLFTGTLPSLTKDLSKIGTRVGMVLTLVSIGPLTGPPVAGTLIAHGGYIAAQVWAGSCLFVGTMALISARLVVSGWKFKVQM